MRLQIISGFFYLSIESYHRRVFRLLLAGLCLMYTQPCFGLNLYSQNPKLTVVPVGLPTDITTLDLANNEISEIGAGNFTGLSSVNRLYLSKNRITHIDDNAFLPCAALTTLRLNENQLKAMPATLGPNTPNMKQLNIRENPHCVIEESWFRPFRSLEQLLMENIGMRELPNDFFTGLISLKLLRISKTNAPNLTERTINLENLLFEDHIGSTYPDEYFLNLTKLTKVSMSGGDPMTSVPRFLGATALETLWFKFFTESVPNLSHLISLNDLTFFPNDVTCDHRLCWTLFETFTFSLTYLEIDHPMAGCRKPEEFKSRPIYSISKLELGCYDSKFIRQGMANIRPVID